ncbi:MFS transporter [Leucobacter sp. CSA1]|uniref:MFS transporter n=1 Tax=Leucobacter chromiisoli TaxID=2796471 RepID=A0A934Q8C0_9MICO|nr:MFS transporter [Leucobacter chromiisoli]MBK0420104.1 MFS transporter [Leucobacter chromiisoli]
MRRVLIFAAVNLVALGSLTAPAITGLPMLVGRLVPESQRTSSLAFVVTCGALTAVLANPVFGIASDWTRSRFGRRRPWLLGGVLAGWGASAALLNAASVAELAAAWVVAQAGYNATLAAVAGFVGDQVEERTRASASGVFGAAAFLGTLPPLALAAMVPSRLDVLILAMPSAAVIVATICCAVISDPAPRLSTPPPFSREGARQLREILRNRAFVWIWGQRLLMQLAFSLATSFTLYFVMARLRLSPEAASPVVAAATLLGGTGIVLAAVTAGFAAGRRGRYGPYLVVSGAGLAFAGMLRATASGEPQLWLAAAVGGIAMGVYFAVDLALALRTIPDGRAGTYLGLLNVAETLPQAVAPGIAVAMLSSSGPDPLSTGADNYLALYMSAGVLALVALAAVRFIGPALTRTVPRDAQGYRPDRRS